MTIAEFNVYMNKKFDDLIEKLCPQVKCNNENIAPNSDDLDSQN